jgi:hypothetical protein
MSLIEFGRRHILRVRGQRRITLVVIAGSPFNPSIEDGESRLLFKLKERIRVVRIRQ